MISQNHLELLVATRESCTTAMQRLRIQSEQESLWLSLDTQEWRVEVGHARRSYVTKCGSRQPITKIAATQETRKSSGLVSFTVDCGGPPTLVLQTLTSAKITLAISHEQQDQILDVIEEHLERNGFDALSQRHDNEAVNLA